MPEHASVSVDGDAAADSAADGNFNDALVTLKYHALPRESKRYLDKVLQSWSDYHKSTYAEVKSNDLESGTVVYNPAAIAAGDMVVFVDRPAARDERSSSTFLSTYETTNDVPKYDRTFESSSNPLTLDGTGERIAILASTRAERRCHNCGSYAHMVSSCPHERNQEASGRQRTQVGTGSGRSRSVTARYYADTGAAGARGGAAGAEFTQLTPGQLSDETRAALGIGPLDPPPWLDKMRELGYPPMHRHVNPKEDELTIHDDQTGERKPVRQSTRTSQPSVPDGAELVAFPGINAPIPEGADPYTWGQQPVAAGSKRTRSDDPTPNGLLPPPPLKRIKTTDNPFLPPAAAHHQMTASARLESLHPSGSNSSAFNVLSSAHSHGPYLASPVLGPGHTDSLPIASNPFTVQPSDPFTGQPSNSYASQSGASYHAQPNGGIKDINATQDQLQAHFAAASQFAASQASAAQQYPPPSPFHMQSALQYPGMPHPGFPPAYPHMHPAYANHAAYAAYAARLVSAGSYPNPAMHMQHHHGVHMPNPYQYAPASLPSSALEVPPPPPPY